PAGGWRGRWGGGGGPWWVGQPAPGTAGHGPEGGAGVRGVSLNRRTSSDISDQLLLRPAGASVAARCVRRTVLGSPPPTPSPAGTAWRSGRQAPAARRGGSGPGRPG